MLNSFSFHRYLHRHMSLHLHKTTSTLVKYAGIFCVDGLFGQAPYNISPRSRRVKKGRKKVIIVTIKY